MGVEEYREAGRQRWISGIKSLYPTAVPAYSTAISPKDIERTLIPFMGQGINHAHFSSGGGMDIQEVKPSNERGCIELIPGDNSAYIVKPAELTFRYFDKDPAQSYLFLKLDTLAPSGIYGNQSFRDTEELVELTPREYARREIWDRGYAGHDEYGDEIPLPRSARIIMRYLTGSILFVGQGSLWNSLSETYDGEHDRLGEPGVFELISRYVDR